VISRTYKLTPSEMRVLMMIVQIGGVPEIAPVLGIAEATAKTHLQRVFEKTGAKRQADLVKLVAGYMSPLAQ
jgi:DNA-binding CsgD family transcriptional regulator